MREHLPAGELRNFAEAMRQGCSKDEEEWEKSQTTSDHDYPSWNPKRAANPAEVRSLRGFVRVFSGCPQGPRAEMAWGQKGSLESGLYTEPNPYTDEPWDLTDDLDFPPPMLPSHTGADSATQTGASPGIGPGTTPSEAQQKQEVG